MTNNEVLSIDVTNLPCKMYYGDKVKTKLKLNSGIVDPTIAALTEIGNFINKNKDLYHVQGISTAGTYNPDSAYAYPHKYALGIDLFNGWTYSKNGKTYAPYSTNGPGQWKNYEKFICEVCNGQEDCNLNLNYHIANIFKKHGFCWGGDWGPKYFDPMHYEWHKESSCSTSNKARISCD